MVHLIRQSASTDQLRRSLVATALAVPKIPQGFIVSVAKQVEVARLQLRDHGLPTVWEWCARGLAGVQVLRRNACTGQVREHLARNSDGGIPHPNPVVHTYRTQNVRQPELWSCQDDHAGVEDRSRKMWTRPGTSILKTSTSSGATSTATRKR